MPQARLRESIAHVGQALREPESFALRWDRGEARYAWWVWAALATTAIVGTTTYGMTMGISGGASAIFWKGLSCSAAAGLAWSIPLPALYILNSLSGSRLRISTTFLTALVTTSWGGLAMIASIPISWFFSVSLPEVIPALAGEIWVTRLILLLNLAVFAGVGVAMIDVFGRVMCAIEPQRGRGPTWWLVVVGAIGSELFYAFGLFQFSFNG
jgi:hypothetical protein